MVQNYRIIPDFKIGMKCQALKWLSPYFLGIVYYKTVFDWLILILYPPRTEKSVSNIVHTTRWRHFDDRNCVLGTSPIRAYSSAIPLPLFELDFQSILICYLYSKLVETWSLLIPPSHGWGSHQNWAITKVGQTIRTEHRCMCAGACVCLRVHLSMCACVFTAVMKH